MDELMNYMSRFRREGLNEQLYDFIMNLTGVDESEVGAGGFGARLARS